MGRCRYTLKRKRVLGIPLSKFGQSISSILAKIGATITTAV